MEERAEKAVALMQKGYNCAQAVACAFAEEADTDEKTIFRVAEGFGSGTRNHAGRLRRARGGRHARGPLA